MAAVRVCVCVCMHTYLVDYQEFLSMIGNLEAAGQYGKSKQKLKEDWTFHCSTVIFIM